MHFSWRLQVLYLTPLLLVLCVIFLVAGPTDSEVVKYFSQIRRENLLATKIIRAITDWTGPLLIAAYCIFAIRSLVAKHREGVRFVLTFAVVQYGFFLFVVHALKFCVGNPRPYAGDIPPQPFSTGNAYHSFPSGHTYETTGLCGPLAQMRGGLIALAIGTIPALMGFTRIYLGQHHLVDIAVGALLASLSTFCTLHFFTRFGSRKKTRVKKTSCPRLRNEIAPTITN